MKSKHLSNILPWRRPSDANANILLAIMFFLVLTSLVSIIFLLFSLFLPLSSRDEDTYWKTASVSQIFLSLSSLLIHHLAANVRLFNRTNKMGLGWFIRRPKYFTLIKIWKEKRHCQLYRSLRELMLRVGWGECFSLLKILTGL